MKHWTTINTFEDLETFNIAFRELSDSEKQVITTEMLEYIEDYAKNVRVIPAALIDVSQVAEHQADSSRRRRRVTRQRSRPGQRPRTG